MHNVTLRYGQQDYTPLAQAANCSIIDTKPNTTYSTSQAFVGIDSFVITYKSVYIRNRRNN